jgi:molybdate transport system substrate-binding protein
MRRLRLFAILMLCSLPVSAADLLVAVASNFHPVLEEIVARFGAETGHRVRLVPGSTGKHYAQIRNGAPFDLFLAADIERPQKLEQEGLAVSGSRFTYALGTLVLWSPDEQLIDPDGDVLRSAPFRRLAIANPRLAPYGRAARQTLETMGLWEALRPRLVRGENIAQAFHFVHSGNAELGLLARSQINTLPAGSRGSAWEVPAELHEPIAQQCVLLRDSPAARRFLDHLRAPETLAVIRQFGYAHP